MRRDATAVAALPFIIELLSDFSEADLHTYRDDGRMPVGAGTIRKDGKERMYAAQKTTISALAKSALAGFDALAVRPLVQALENKNPVVAEAASYLLQDQPGLWILKPGPSEPVWEEGSAIVLRVLRRDTPVTWVGAASAARYLTDPRHLELLLGRANAESALVRAQCIRALGAHVVDLPTTDNLSRPHMIRNENAFKAILRAANDPARGVRKAAAESLAGLTEPEAARALGGLIVAAKLSPPAYLSEIELNEEAREAAFRSLDDALRRLPQSAGERAHHPFALALRESCTVAQLLPQLRNRWGHPRAAGLLALVAGESDLPALVRALTTQPNDAAIIVEALQLLTGRKFREADEWQRWHRDYVSGAPPPG